ncbi:unknown [[Mannheimia] succiniciproducens MBEL55E]|uniref:Uncharacterized protein n=1 Tax=Mannheimia succiniciproducens (strain KCTC 0769BP / MBEL55E) TaxID=221988 RepID=Q65U38_MANSM|nr:unknown [[Mannheimia] succiniciproducens MBEL55E]
MLKGGDFSLFQCFFIDKTKGFRSLLEKIQKNTRFFE